MIKKILLAFLTFFVLLVVGLVLVKNSLKPVGTGQVSKSFLIPKGSSASQIGNNLEKEGLIRSSLAFKIYVQFSGKQRSISAGEFKLSPSMNLFEIVDTLQKGPIELWVTIPEGLRHEEIAAKFTEGLEKDAAFQKELTSLFSTHEGYLFPETYLFPKEITAQKILDKMLSTFDAKVGQNVTKEQVIMASIIERETKGDAEKPVVAGILYKRIENGWPLQVDASIQYVKGDWKPILVADKELNSSYNTYKYQGLPPGPISNPGLASIEAAMNPENSDYWYYLHEDDGTIHYAKTIEEHNANIRKYLY